MIVALPALFVSSTLGWIAVAVFWLQFDLTLLTSSAYGLGFACAVFISMIVTAALIEAVVHGRVQRVSADLAYSERKPASDFRQQIKHD